MDSFSFRDRQRISTLNNPPSFKTGKASSNRISYVNTSLAKHEDDAEPVTNWNNIHDQARDGLIFQNRILPKQRGIDVGWVTEVDLPASKKGKGAKAINQERKRYSSWSAAIKLVAFKQPTADSTVALKTCYRQTDRQKLSLPSDRLYPFSLENNGMVESTSNVHRLPIHSSLDWSFILPFVQYFR